MKRIAFIFPGQGSQKVGMSRDFYDSFAVAREVFEEAEDVLHNNIREIVFNGPENILLETRYSQIGIYIASMAILRTVQQQFNDIVPKYCAGLSLGEYTAATAAKKIEYKDCLPLVWARGNYMHEACESRSGTMAAIIGMSSVDVGNMVRELNMPKDLWVANYNTPDQTVISGTIKGVTKGIENAKARGARKAMFLQVHGAFHSGLMQCAEDRLAEKVASTDIVDSDIKLFANVTGEEVCDISSIRYNLIKQVTSPVRWEHSIRNMDSQGVDLFIEIGPGKTLAGMNKRIKVSAPTISIATVSDMEGLLEIL